VAAKIRHTHDPAAATIEPLGAGGVLVRFERPQRAPAPGQSVVFYQGDLVVGGGVIARPEGP
jgi:tRNA-specific 2-thiouridylase